MHLAQLQLVNFKNYADQRVDFHPKLNVLVGLNGAGKTNLLDAIYTLCCGKSYFQSADKLLMRHDTDFFRLVGGFVEAEISHRVEAKFGRQRKKELSLDGRKYDRLAEHVGRFPVNIIAPDDIMIVKGGGSDRRRLFDFAFSQLQAGYLEALIRYNRALAQRLAYLKSLDDPRLLEVPLLDSLDAQLIEWGRAVFQWRRVLTDRLRDPFAAIYRNIADGRETASLRYDSQLIQTDFADLLRQNRNRDIYLKRNSTGPHRDDWPFALDGQPVRRFGSQGQQKTYLIALKLALNELLEVEKQVRPILLLDDVFDKLDRNRIRELVGLMAESGGQLFLTDADLQRLPAILNEVTLPFKLFRVENGAVYETAT